MIKEDIYRKYFQKSYTFMFPLLKLKPKKGPFFKPSQTYLCWENRVNIGDLKLVCKYSRVDSDEWRKYEKNFLLSHKMLDYCEPIDDKTVVYVFNLDAYKEDYTNFLNGKYSKLSNETKTAIADYYGIHTPEWVYMESYLYPESYFDKYAAILGINSELLRNVGELCDSYDDQKECLIIEKI